jgi:hypothetical protein
MILLLQKFPFLMGNIFLQRWELWGAIFVMHGRNTMTQVFPLTERTM